MSIWNAEYILVNNIPISTYTIPARTILYKGNSSKTEPSIPSEPAWFATEEKVALLYGYPAIYRVTHPIVLVNFSDPATHRLSQYMYHNWAKANRWNSKGFDTAYPIHNDTVIRDSSFDADTLVQNWFVDAHSDKTNPYSHLDGYGNNIMPTYGKHHHAEMMIINARNHMEYIGTIEVTDPILIQRFMYNNMQKQDAIRRFAARKLRKEEEKKKRLLRQLRHSRQLFEDEENEEEEQKNQQLSLKLFQDDE
jgi:hypothetical protein